MDINNNDLPGNTDPVYVSRNSNDNLTDFNVSGLPSLEPTSRDTALGSSYAAVAASSASAPAAPDMRELLSNTPSTRLFSIRSTVGRDLRFLNIFSANQELRRSIGEFSKFDHADDKSISITVKSTNQANLLLKLEKLLGEPVKVEVHPSCRRSQGIITCPVLRNMHVDDILEGLCHHHITKVTRISQATATFRLAFNIITPPQTINICPGHTVRVRPVYPLPTRCFKCQNYGHSHTSCRSKCTICSNCGQEGDENHDPKSCTRPAQCFHCKEPHSATSPQCSKYLIEKKILQIHHKDKIPLPDARRQVLKERSSYGSLAKPNTVSNNRNHATSREDPIPPVIASSPAATIDIPEINNRDHAPREDPISPADALSPAATMDIPLPPTKSCKPQTEDMSEKHPKGNRFSVLEDRDLDAPDVTNNRSSRKRSLSPATKSSQIIKSKHANRSHSSRSERNRESRTRRKDPETQETNNKIAVIGSHSGRN